MWMKRKVAVNQPSISFNTSNGFAYWVLYKSQIQGQYPWRGRLIPAHCSLSLDKADSCNQLSAQSPQQLSAVRSNQTNEMQSTQMSWMHICNRPAHTRAATKRGRQRGICAMAGNHPPLPKLPFKCMLINPLIQLVFDSQLIKMRSG